MRIIDRYVLRMYLRVLLVCFLSLAGLYIVIDVFTHLDELLELAAERGTLLGLLCEYYGARVLMFFDRTSALMTLVAATVVATSLQRSNELAALMGAGIPKARVVAAIIGGTFAISLLAAVNREVFIPPFRDRLMRDLQDWDGRAEKRFDPRYDNRTDILINGHHSLAAEQCIVQPTFRRQPDMGQFGSQLAAERAYYRPAGNDRPGGYWLAGVQMPKNLREVASFSLEGKPVVLSPRDTPWLKTDECFVVSDVSFAQLAAGNAWRQFSSTPELIAGLHNPSLDLASDVRVLVHGRLVQPILDMTLLFLGLPIVLSRQNRSVFVAAGICLLVVAAFVLVILACQAAGNSYLISPAFAAWCPLIIFVPLARLTVDGLWQ
jgi:lipopolysaccharide export system permease protein